MFGIHPRHRNDVPYPGSGGSYPRPAETEEDLKARQFLFACWLDGMTIEDARALWKQKQAEESSS